MIKHIIVIVVFVSIQNPALLFSGQDCPLAGKWQSNEKLTLIEMGKAKSLAEKRINFLSDSFFGKLIVDMTCDEATSYYEGNIDTTKYKILSRVGDALKIELYDGSSDKPSVKTVELRGACYLISLDSLGFSEVFCKIIK